MRSISGVVAFGLALACGTASAQPTNDVAGWAQRFTEAVLKSDTDLILGVIKEISDPRLNMDGVRGLIQGGVSIMSDETPEYSEQFDEKTVGTFLKRINVAVRYSKNFLFYSVVVARGEKGWQLVQINNNGNLNKILEAPWPS